MFQLNWGPTHRATSATSQAMRRRARIWGTCLETCVSWIVLLSGFYCIVHTYNQLVEDGTFKLLGIACLGWYKYMYVAYLGLYIRRAVQSAHLRCYTLDCLIKRAVHLQGRIRLLIRMWGPVCESRALGCRTTLKAGCKKLSLYHIIICW